jgi:NAD(P)-dependent dehydrogenase (short-subunit alcohol dehydrogenase family)
MSTQHSQRSPIISGAAHGIGAAIAIEAAAGGRPLVLLDSDSGAVGDLGERLRDHVACLAVACDVTDEAQVDDAIARAHGGLTGPRRDLRLTHQPCTPARKR